MAPRQVKSYLNPTHLQDPLNLVDGIQLIRKNPTANNTEKQSRSISVTRLILPFSSPVKKVDAGWKQSAAPLITVFFK